MRDTRVRAERKVTGHQHVLGSSGIDGSQVGIQLEQSLADLYFMKSSVVRNLMRVLFIENFF